MKYLVATNKTKLTKSQDLGTALHSLMLDSGKIGESLLAVVTDMGLTCHFTSHIKLILYSQKMEVKEKNIKWNRTLKTRFFFFNYKAQNVC